MDFGKNWKMKKPLTVISNDTGFKLFTFNQAIVEVYCREQAGVTLVGIFCISN